MLSDLRTLLYTLNTGKERLRASNLLPVHLLGEEEVDHDHPASKYCEDGDEEAEDGLPDDPECLKVNMGWMHGVFWCKRIIKPPGKLPNNVENSVSCGCQIYPGRGVRLATII